MRFGEKSLGFYVLGKDETNAKVSGSCCLELDFLPKVALLPPPHSSLTRLQLRPPHHSTLGSPTPAQNALEVTCYSRQDTRFWTWNELKLSFGHKEECQQLFFKPYFVYVCWGESFRAKMVTDAAHLMQGEAGEEEELPIKSQKSTLRPQARLSPPVLSLSLIQSPLFSS